ncbi:MAG: Fe-S protein assembly chaperone HscA [Alphaproteobacteria bacterium]|nr:Fe-S protein assembly chaperone HscA [Alphaproteobacteria bacterium]
MLLQIHEPGETPDPHASDAGHAVGIDLGTTNSLVAISRDEKPEVLRDERGNGIVPSVVAYGDDPLPLVGEAARRMLLDRPEIVVSSVKRLMGRGREDVQRLAGLLPFEIAGEAGGTVRLVIGGRRLTPVEISADILRALKARAEAALGVTVDKAVVTVPAYFDDAARTATRDAARVAGLEVLRLVNEPTAAALAYGLDKGAEGLYAVYDLGGGTFDVSLLRMEKGVFQVLATGGDTKLGGDDFDHLVAERFLAERKTLGAPAPTAGETKQVLATARLAKECLTDRTEGSWTVDVGGVPTRHRLDRATFETMISPLVERSIRLAQGVLEDARIDPAEVKGVVLVGGSTRVLLVRRRVAEVFGRPPLGDINPDEVVALGAALQAEALTRGSDTLLLDVTPLSLGIETMGGIVEKVIPRNSPIPVALAQEFTTYQDGQTAMMIHVVQGERELVQDCRSLGRFELHGIPPMVAGAARIRVAFAVDADGLLTVTAREETTGVESRVEVKPSYGLAPEDMIRMLSESQEHARVDMAARLLIEARVEGRRVLNALRPAVAADGDLLNGAERAVIDAAVARLEKAIAGEDRDAINAAVAALDEAGTDFAQRRMDRSLRVAVAGSTVEQLSRRIGADKA